MDAAIKYSTEARKAPKNMTHFYTILELDPYKKYLLSVLKSSRGSRLRFEMFLQPILLYCVLGFWLFERRNIRKTLFCMSFL